MLKTVSNLWSLLVVFVIVSKWAASFDTNISYQIEEINSKLTYLQGRLDLFDYITEGNVSVLQHRVEVNESKYAEKIAQQLNDTNEKLNDVADKVGSVDTKMNALEGKLTELETTVTTNMTTILHQAENVTLQIKETNVKLNDLVNKFASVDTRMNFLESKFNDLASAFTKFVGDIKVTLLKPSSSCTNAFANPIFNRGSGIYDIQLDGNSSPFNVYCMADSKGGLPWTVVQRRVDATVDFYRNWTEYQRGFGDLEGNVFIGLDKLHSLTTKGEPQELWVMLTDPGGISAHAYYNAFAIGNETEKYPLKVLGKYSGDAGDSLSYHKSMKFSTFDNDNDNSGNCAEYYKSAWWFNSCHRCQLNGVYGSTEKAEGLSWIDFRDQSVTMKYAHLAIRPSRK